MANFFTELKNFAYNFFIPEIGRKLFLGILFITLLTSIKYHTEITKFAFRNKQIVSIYSDKSIHISTEYATFMELIDPIKKEFRGNKNFLFISINPVVTNIFHSEKVLKLIDYELGDTLNIGISIDHKEDDYSLVINTKDKSSENYHLIPDHENKEMLFTTYYPANNSSFGVDFSIQKNMEINDIQNEINNTIKILISQIYLCSSEFTIANEIISSIDPESMHDSQNLLKNKTYQLMGLLSLIDQNSELAITYFDKALHYSPEDVISHRNRAITLKGMGYFREAVEEMNWLIKTGNSIPFDHILLADLYEYLGEYGNSFYSYSKFIELQPENFGGYYLRGSAFYESGEYDKAIFDFDIAISLAPKNPILYDSRGLAYAQNGEFQLAVEDSSSAITLDPNEAGYYLRRGWFLYQLGDYTAAKEDCSKAIELTPNNTILYYIKGLIYVRLSEHDEALQMVNMIIELDENNANAHHLRGEIYSDLEKHSLAIQEFTLAISLEPNMIDYYQSRGTEYFLMGEGEKGENDFLKAIELTENESSKQDLQMELEKWKNSDET